MPLALLLGVGATVGLAFVGLVDVPFLPFHKAKRKGPPPPKDDGRGGPFAPMLALAQSYGRLAEKPPAKGPAPLPEPPDTGPGEEKLAGLWGEMPVDRLVPIVQGWPPAPLGRILSRMDDEAVTNLLAALPAPKAAELSRAVARATDEKAAKVHPDGGK